MGAQQSGNATVPPAAPESETRTKVDSSFPRVDHRPPDVANFASTTPPPGHPAGGGDAPVQEKKKLKPCCACPETKKIRDECIMQEGEENCQHLIEAHKACMRSLGFNI